MPAASGHAMRSFDAVIPGLTRIAVELPSWASGAAGTRFQAFAQPDVPRTEG